MPTNKAVSMKVSSSALSALSGSVALPHEKQPERLPIVPVTYTAVISLMADRTWAIADGANRRAVLCRSPTFPLWMDQTISSFSSFITDPVYFPSGTTTGSTLAVPNFTRYGTNASGTIDGINYPAVAQIRRTPFTLPKSGISIFIPFGSRLCAEVTITGATGGVIVVGMTYSNKGVANSSTVSLTSQGGGVFAFRGTAGTLGVSVGSLLEGNIPYGEVAIEDVSVGADITGTLAGWNWALGFASGGSLQTPTSSLTVMLPFAAPPELSNSPIPYEHSRANATAALFTNVGAQLYQEGTVLAGRLKHERVDFQTFGVTDIDAIQPAMRYFGPLTKGLYTFTLPNDDSNLMQEMCVTGVVNIVGDTTIAAVPIFVPDLGVYNAIVFSDLGSGAGATQLAVSQYTHIEFDTVSSLFRVGASTHTLEDLHRAELALLKFGVFHENPLHFSLLTKALGKAVAAVAPIVMPYAKAAATKLINKGAQYLHGKVKGDRTMPPPTNLMPHNKTKGPSRARKAPPRSNRRRK